MIVYLHKAIEQRAKQVKPEHIGWLSPYLNALGKFIDSIMQYKRVGQEGWSKNYEIREKQKKYEFFLLQAESIFFLRDSWALLKKYGNGVYKKAMTAIYDKYVSTVGMIIEISWINFVNHNG